MCRRGREGMSAGGSWEINPKGGVKGGTLSGSAIGSSWQKGWLKRTGLKEKN